VIEIELSKLRALAFNLTQTQIAMVNETKMKQMQAQLQQMSAAMSKLQIRVGTIDEMMN